MLIVIAVESRTYPFSCNFRSKRPEIIMKIHASVHLGSCDRRGPDRVFDQVVVDLHAAILQEHLQRRPLTECIINGGGERTLWQRPAAALESKENALQSLYDGSALMSANGLAQLAGRLSFRTAGIQWRKDVVVAAVSLAVSREGFGSRRGGVHRKLGARISCGRAGDHGAASG